jgi:tRNA(Arg) A34 adenosine deaminase TadA
MIDYEKFMQEAIAQARQGLREGEVPIGAVAVKNGKIIARGHNRRIQSIDITRHAEIDCISDMSGILDDNFDMSGITLYSTLEPCAMCSGAMIHYGIKKVVYGEIDIIKGAAGTKYNFLKEGGVEAVGGVLRNECRQVLLSFFQIQLGKPSFKWKDIELPEK